jgi:hypothetical protein
MKSIKPGRGPSAMGAMGSVIAVVFGIFWTITAASMGAPIMFPVFGVLFIGMGIVQGFYHYKNATGKNRFSTFDITDESEERDPLEDLVRGRENKEAGVSRDLDESENGNRFCPYCGTKVEEAFQFCSKCGKKLPSKMS